MSDDAILMDRSGRWIKVNLRGKELESLQAQLAASKKREEILRGGLGSISRNGCCDTCQQAKLVSLETLKKADEVK